MVFLSAALQKEKKQKYVTKSVSDEGEKRFEEKEEMNEFTASQQCLLP